MTSARVRQRRTVAARDVLVATALALTEEGTESTMRAVTVAAGVSERTIHRYFPSREELFGSLAPELRARAHVPVA
jgi:AcrR family transcriptional regulator